MVSQHVGPRLPPMLAVPLPARFAQAGFGRPGVRRRHDAWAWPGAHRWRLRWAGPMRPRNFSSPLLA